MKKRKGKKQSTAAAPQKMSPTAKYYTVITIIALLPFIPALTGSNLGQYMSLYISTALVGFGIIDLVRVLKKKTKGEKFQGLPQIITIGIGLVVGIALNTAVLIRPEFYLSLLIMQFVTIGFVLWMRGAVPTNGKATE